MLLHIDPNCRHDFVLLFDVTDGNPNRHLQKLIIVLT